jgi:hypothetical protein
MLENNHSSHDVMAIYLCLYMVEHLHVQHNLNLKLIKKNIYIILDKVKKNYFTILASSVNCPTKYNQIFKRGDSVC